MADHQVVGRGLRRAIDGPQCQREVPGLQQLPAHQRQRHALLRVVTVAGKIVAGDGNARRVHAGTCQPASLGEREDVGTVVAPDAQHHTRFGALPAPVPVLAVQQAAVLGDLGHEHGAGASVRVAVGARHFRRRLAHAQDLGARVHQRHIGQLHIRALGDATHFLEIQRLEAFDLGQEAGGQPAHFVRIGVCGAAVQADAAADAITRLPAILPSPFARLARQLNEGKEVDLFHDTHCVDAVNACQNAYLRAAGPANRHRPHRFVCMRQLRIDARPARRNHQSRQCTNLNRIWLTGLMDAGC
jgi:hypothetical protein